MLAGRKKNPPKDPLTNLYSRLLPAEAAVPDPAPKVTTSAHPSAPSSGSARLVVLLSLVAAVIASIEDIGDGAREELISPGQKRL